jgi:Zn ribbon nucleic-acid-binding protein
MFPDRTRFIAKAFCPACQHRLEISGYDEAEILAAIEEEKGHQVAIKLSKRGEELQQERIDREKMNGDFDTFMSSVGVSWPKVSP